MKSVFYLLLISLITGSQAWGEGERWQRGTYRFDHLLGDVAGVTIAGQKLDDRFLHLHRGGGITEVTEANGIIQIYTRDTVITGKGLAIVTNPAPGEFVIDVTGVGTPGSGRAEALIGTGTAKIFSVTHDLGYQNVSVSLIDNYTGKLTYANVVLESTSTVILRFATAPGINQYTVLMISGGASSGSSSGGVISGNHDDLHNRNSTSAHPQYPLSGHSATITGSWTFNAPGPPLNIGPNSMNQWIEGANVDMVDNHHYETPLPTATPFTVVAGNGLTVDKTNNSYIVSAFTYTQTPIPTNTPTPTPVFTSTPTFTIVPTDVPPSPVPTIKVTGTGLAKVAAITGGYNIDVPTLLPTATSTYTPTVTNSPTATFTPTLTNTATPTQRFTGSGMATVVQSPGVVNVNVPPHVETTPLPTETPISFHGAGIATVVQTPGNVTISVIAPPTYAYIPPSPQPTYAYVPPSPQPTYAYIPPSPQPTYAYVPPSPQPTYAYIRPSPQPTYAYVPPSPQPTYAYIPPSPQPTYAYVPPSPVPPIPTRVITASGLGETTPIANGVNINVNAPTMTPTPVNNYLHVHDYANSMVAGWQNDLMTFWNNNSKGFQFISSNDAPFGLRGMYLDFSDETLGRKIDLWGGIYGIGVSSFTLDVTTDKNISFSSPARVKAATIEITSAKSSMQANEGVFDYIRFGRTYTAQEAQNTFYANGITQVMYLLSSMDEIALIDEDGTTWNIPLWTKTQVVAMANADDKFYFIPVEGTNRYAAFYKRF